MSTCFSDVYHTAYLPTVARPLSLLAPSIDTLTFRLLRQRPLGSGLVFLHAFVQHFNGSERTFERLNNFVFLLVYEWCG